MANVKVAVRVRPLSQRECESGAQIIVDMKGNTTSVANLKVPENSDADSRERVRHFVFDFCYLSAVPGEPRNVTQEMIFNDLGSELLESVFDGYNACILAYGPSGSGKTYTMMGLPDELGLIPRMCQKLFTKISESSGGKVTFRTDISFLEIYNERVCDLLQPTFPQKNRSSLKVREHPKLGTYVQDLTKHRVPDFKSVSALIERGNHNRSVASTETHSRSSRSHAIFTINFTQACLDAEMPSEIVSKIHLVDLAGSERASIIFNKTRLKEGSNINKSLVTLGNVISALAEKSLSSWSLDSLGSNYSINSAGESVTNSPASSPRRLRQPFVPYRDSVLTWLLKDSLGGNSKTIMIATISAASTCYSETIGTLRYAQRAKNIVNKPVINEDPYVKLIRDLRAEISRLRALLAAAQTNNIINSPRDEVSIAEILNQNERKAFTLTKSWMEKWQGYKSLVQDSEMSVHKSTSSVFVDSPLPHLVVLDNHILSTGIKIYYLKQGKTLIGNDSSEIADIGIAGSSILPEHCELNFDGTDVVLTSIAGAVCFINDQVVHDPTRLRQADILKLGNDVAFRFNHPSQVQKLRADTSFRQFNVINYTTPNVVGVAHCCSCLFKMEQHHPTINLFQHQQCCLGLPLCPVLYNGSPNSVRCLIHSPLPRCCGLCVVEGQHHRISSEFGPHYVDGSFSCGQNSNGCCAAVESNVNYNADTSPDNGSHVFHQVNEEQCGNLSKFCADRVSAESLKFSAHACSQDAETRCGSSSTEVKSNSSTMTSLVPKNLLSSAVGNELFTNANSLSSHYTSAWQNENEEKSLSLWNNERCSPIGDSGSDVGDNGSLSSCSHLSDDTADETLLRGNSSENNIIASSERKIETDRLNGRDKKLIGDLRADARVSQSDVHPAAAKSSKTLSFSSCKCRCQIRKTRTNTLRGNKKQPMKKKLSKSCKFAKMRKTRCCKKCVRVKWEKKVSHMFTEYKNKTDSEVINIEKLCLPRDLRTKMDRKLDINLPQKTNVPVIVENSNQSPEVCLSSQNVFNPELLNNVQQFVDFVKDITDSDQLVKVLSKPTDNKIDSNLLHAETNTNINKTFAGNESPNSSKSYEKTIKVEFPVQSDNEIPLIAVDDSEDQIEDSSFNPDVASSAVNDSNMLLVLSAVDLELKRSLSHNDIQQALQSSSDVKDEVAASASVYVPPIKIRTNSWPEPSQLSLDQLDSEIKDLQDSLKEELVSQVLGNIENALADDVPESPVFPKEDERRENVETFVNWEMTSQNQNGTNEDGSIFSKKLVRQTAKLRFSPDFLDDFPSDDGQEVKNSTSRIENIPLDFNNSNGEFDDDYYYGNICASKNQGRGKLERTGRLHSSADIAIAGEEESINERDSWTQKDNADMMNDDVYSGCGTKARPFILITQPSDSFSESGVVLDENAESVCSNEGESDYNEKCDDQSAEFPYSDDFESDEDDFVSEEQIEEELGEDESDEDIFYIPIEELRGLSPAQFCGDVETMFDPTETSKNSQDSLSMKGLSVTNASERCQVRIPGEKYATFNTEDAATTLTAHVQLQENASADSECFVRSYSHHNEELGTSPRNLVKGGGTKAAAPETENTMDEDSRPLIDFSTPCDLNDDVFAVSNSIVNPESVFSPIDILIDYRMLSPSDRHRLYTIPELSSEYSSTPTDSFLGSVSEVEGATAEDECALLGDTSSNDPLRSKRGKADYGNEDRGRTETSSWEGGDTNADCNGEGLSGDLVKEGGAPYTPNDDEFICYASEKPDDRREFNEESCAAVSDCGGNNLKSTATTHFESSMAYPAIGLDSKCGLGEDIGGESCGDKKTGRSMIMQSDNSSVGCNVLQEKPVGVASPTNLGQAPAACRELWKLYKQFSEDSDEETGNAEQNGTGAIEEKIGDGVNGKLLLSNENVPIVNAQQVECEVDGFNRVEELEKPDRITNACGARLDIDGCRCGISNNNIDGVFTVGAVCEVYDKSMSQLRSSSKINDSDANCEQTTRVNDDASVFAENASEINLNSLSTGTRTSDVRVVNSFIRFNNGDSSLNEYCELDDIQLELNGDSTKSNEKKTEEKIDKKLRSCEGQMSVSCSDRNHAWKLEIETLTKTNVEDSPSDEFACGEIANRVSNHCNDRTTAIEAEENPNVSEDPCLLDCNRVNDHTTSPSLRGKKMKEFVDDDCSQKISNRHSNEPECLESESYDSKQDIGKNQDVWMPEEIDEITDASAFAKHDINGGSREFYSDGFRFRDESTGESGEQTFSVKPTRERSITPDSLEDIHDKSANMLNPNFRTWKMHQTPGTSNLTIRNKSPSPLGVPRSFHLRNQELGAFGDLWGASNDSITFVFVGPGSTLGHDMFLKKNFQHPIPKSVHKHDPVGSSLRQCLHSSSLFRSVSLDCINLQGIMQCNLTTRASSMESMVPEDLMGVVERGRLHEIDLEELNGNTASPSADDSEKTPHRALKYCMHQKKALTLPSRALSQGSVLDPTLQLKKSKKSVSWSDLSGRELTLDEGSISKQQTQYPIKPIIKKADFNISNLNDNVLSCAEYTESDAEEDLNKSALFTRIQKKRNPTAWTVPTKAQSGFALKLPDHVKARIVKHCKPNGEDVDKKQEIENANETAAVNEVVIPEVEKTKDECTNLKKIASKEQVPPLAKIFEAFLKNQNIVRELQRMDAVHYLNNNHHTNFINQLSVDCDWNRLSIILAEASTFFQKLSSFCESRTSSEIEKIPSQDNGRRLIFNDIETQTPPELYSKIDSATTTDFLSISESQNRPKRHSLPSIFDKWTNDVNDKQFLLKNNLLQACKSNADANFVPTQNKNSKVDSAVQVNTLNTILRSQKEHSKRISRKEACLQKELEILCLERQRVVKALQKSNHRPNGHVKLREDNNNFIDELKDDDLWFPDNPQYLLIYQSRIDNACSRVITKLDKLSKRKERKAHDEDTQSLVDDSSSVSSALSCSSEYLPLEQHTNTNPRHDGDNQYNARRRKSGHLFGQHRSNSSQTLASKSQSEHIRPLDYYAQLLEIRRSVVASSRTESTSSSSSLSSKSKRTSKTEASDECSTISTKYLDSPTYSSTMDSTARDIKTLLWECQAARFRAQHEIELAQEQLKCQRLAVQNLASVLKQKA